MEQTVELCSRVGDCGGVPALFVNEKPLNPMAYMTYLEQYNDYKGFAEKGYRFFSAPVLFAGRWINASSDTPAFKKGIFDEKGKPDFSLFDETAEKILAQCPDALILPRVNMSMPLWWEQEHPEDVNIRPDGTVCRESMYSARWRKDAAEMLAQFVRYVNRSKYAAHMAGYQIAGGNTEEWFHFDMNAGCCRNAEAAFRAYSEKHYPGIPFAGLPDMTKLRKKTALHGDENLARFLEFASVSVAEAIASFAAVVKRETDGKMAVGTFYGYAPEVTLPLHGTHALKILLRDNNIDFICSPCSYLEGRNPEVDWTEMYPADSVRLHGKMCFQECDIRTSLTTLLSEKNIALDPNRVYTAPIWRGPDTVEKSVSLLRKAFCRQLIKGNGLWWFDMWGGWFSDPAMMEEMRRFRQIYGESLAFKNRGSIAEVAAFADESAYRLMADSPLREAASAQRKALGYMGTPYDMYDISDFDSVKGRYKAFIFASPVETPGMKNALAFCRKNRIPFLASSAEKQNFSASELREFCRENGAKIYCETDDILYINSHYAALYAVTAGEKAIRLYEQKRIRRILPEEGEAAVSDRITVFAGQGETVLFEICMEKNKIAFERALFADDGSDREYTQSAVYTLRE